MFYFIVIVWLVLDQLSKYYIMEHFYLGESLPVIPNVLHITYIINRGAAFGILENQQWIFLLVAIILVALAFIYRKTIKNGPLFLRMGMALLISGAIGNGIDRFTIRGVVDFLDFRVWPIFNIADIGICLGVIGVVYYLLRSDSEE